MSLFDQYACTVYSHDRTELTDSTDLYVFTVNTDSWDPGI